MDIDEIDHGSRWTGESFTGTVKPTVELGDVEFADCEFRLAPTDHPWQPNECIFDRCRFVASDLSLSTWADCSVRDTAFTDCRMTGADFSVAKWSAYSMTSPNSFTRCDLSYANFARARLGALGVIECRAIEAEFMEADLTGAIFDDTDLSRATFSRTNLSDADFRTAFGFMIDPTTAKLRGARFSSFSLAGLVLGFGIEID
jgi:fluoroquinolone resistance protein